MLAAPLIWYCVSTAGQRRGALDIHDNLLAWGFFFVGLSHRPPPGGLRMSNNPS